MATVTRPAGGYVPVNPITNTTKYQTDSTNGVAISSLKMDGELNKTFDTLSDHDNTLATHTSTLADHETRIDTLEGAVVSSEFADNNFRVTGSSDATKKVAFEVDGLTTGTTRTKTWQDNSGTVYESGGQDVAVADGGTGLSSYTAGDILYASGTTTLTKLAKGTAYQVLSMNSGATAPEWVSPGMQGGVNVATTSGTSVSLTTSIPTWANRVTISGRGVSTNGTTAFYVRLGTSSGLVTSGYAGVWAIYGGSSGGGSVTAGMLIPGGTAADLRTFNITFTKLTGNIWVGSAVGCFEGTSALLGSATQVDLGATLDRISLVTVNGTDTFDAGSATVWWER